MVCLHRLGRLGNVLSQYCFARVLAGRFCYTLEACPIAGFSGSSKRIYGEESFCPEVMWTGHWPREAYSGRKLERLELFQAPGVRVTLRGLFQRFEYISDIRDEVRKEWMRMNDPLSKRPSGDFAICLHVADGDREVDKSAAGKEGGNTADGVLNEAEIRRLAKTVPHERIYIVTDEPGHPMIESLKDLHPIIQAEGGMKDFKFIHSFQKVAICQSTFHWWATFLGAAREICFPKMNRGLWSHPEPPMMAWEPGHFGTDLRVDEERYIYEW